MKKPPFLKPGSKISFIAPSGYIDPSYYQKAVSIFKNEGFKVELGPSLNRQFHYFSGTDEQRLIELQYYLDDETTSVIFCVRGGYGLSRIIDKIDFTKFKKNPKWVSGFSDITILLMAILKECEVCCLHAPMAKAFGQENTYYYQSLISHLKGKANFYKTPPHPLNVKGQVKGEIIGGNLALLTHLIGSKTEVITNDKILFLEDVGEYLYSIDRMLIQFKRAGFFNRIKALIMGSFSELRDTKIPFGKSIEEIIKENIEDTTFPCCFDFPIGHTEKNVSIILGTKYFLDINDQEVCLTEV